MPCCTTRDAVTECPRASESATDRTCFHCRLRRGHVTLDRRFDLLAPADPCADGPGGRGSPPGACCRTVSSSHWPGAGKMTATAAARLANQRQRDRPTWILRTVSGCHRRPTLGTMDDIVTLGTAGCAVHAGRGSLLREGAGRRRRHAVPHGSIRSRCVSRRHPRRISVGLVSPGVDRGHAPSPTRGIVSFIGRWPCVGTSSPTKPG